MTPTPTLNQALLHLARRCDGAVARDDVGFNGRDAGFGHSLAEWIKEGRELSAKQAAAALRLLCTYRYTQLATFDWRAMQEEAQRAAAPPTTTVVQLPEIDVVSEDGRIYASSPYTFKDAAKSIPGARWNRDLRRWSYPASASVAAALIKAADAARLKIGGDAGWQALCNGVQQAHDAQAHKTAEALPDIPGRTPAWHHQRQAYHFAAALDAAMLALDMGTGKSKTTIGLLEGWQAERVLILCPVNVLRVWPSEFQRHALRNWRVSDLRGTVAKKAKGMQQELRIAEAEHRPVAILLNYEAAWRPPIDDDLCNIDWDVVVCDESHRIKAPGGRASLFATRVGKRAKRRLCLTGTPMAHTPLDVYAQYRFLDAGVYGTSYHRFKTRYGNWGGFEGRQFEGMNPETSADFAERFASLAFQCKAEDVLDLPEWQEVERTVSLEPSARRIYSEMAKDFISVLDREEGIVATAANAGVKVLRLQQITSGHLPDESGLVQSVSSAKEDLLADVLEDLPPDQPVVVFARFVADLRAIERVAAKVGRRYGELSGARRDALTADARLAPEVGLAGVQIQSGGVGIDLTRASTAVYYSIGHNLSDYQQSLKRIHRPGQTRSTLYVHLLTDAPIDRIVYDALRSRESVIEAVLAAAKAGTIAP